MEETLFGALARRAALDPQGMFMASSWASVSNRGAYAHTAGLAAAMRGRWGIGAGSTVFIAAVNSPEMLQAVAAATALGAGVALVSGCVPDRELARDASLVRPDLLVAEKPQAQALQAALGEVPTLCLDLVEDEGPLLASYERVCARPAPQGLQPAPEARVVVFSSGTTGEPKAVENRMSSYIHNARTLCAAYGMDARDRAFVPVPFSHAFGLVCVAAALLSGAGIVSDALFKPESALDLIHEAGATLEFAVPTMLIRQLVAAEGRAGNPFSTLRGGLTGGATCPAHVIREYEEKWGVRIVRSYGMSETAGTLTIAPPELPVDEREDVDGLPVQGVELRIDHATGEVLVRTPALMGGYITPGGFERGPVDAEGWYATGDIGVIDGTGELAIVGRIKDIIIRGGMNVFPAEVESLYETRDDIAECVLVGFPDPDLGERSCLCVIPDGAAPATPELRAFAKGKLEKCKIPDVVYPFADFPRLPSGKVNKKALVAQVHAMVDSGEISRPRL